MALNRQCKWIAAVLLTAAIGVIGMLHHFRRLILTTDWRAAVEGPNGERIDAAVYRMLGRPNVLFVEFKEPPDEFYRWFSIETDTRSVAIPNRPRETRYLHWTHDMALGVALDDGKIDEGWDIEWNEGEPGFAYARLAVVLEGAEDE